MFHTGRMSFNEDDLDHESFDEGDCFFYENKAINDLEKGSPIGIGEVCDVRYRSLSGNEQFYSSPNLKVESVSIRSSKSFHLPVRDKQKKKGIISRLFIPNENSSIDSMHRNALSKSMRDSNPEPKRRSSHELPGDTVTSKIHSKSGNHYFSPKEKRFLSFRETTQKRSLPHAIVPAMKSMSFEQNKHDVGVEAPLSTSLDENFRPSNFSIHDMSESTLEIISLNSQSTYPIGSTADLNTCTFASMDKSEVSRNESTRSKCFSSSESEPETETFVKKYKVRRRFFALRKLYFHFLSH